MIQKRKKKKKETVASKPKMVSFFSHGNAYELKHLLAIGNSVWVVFCLHIVYFIYEVVFFFFFFFSEELRTRQRCAPSLLFLCLFKVLLMKGRTNEIIRAKSVSFIFFSFIHYIHLFPNCSPSFVFSFALILCGAPAVGVDVPTRMLLAACRAAQSFLTSTGAAPLTSARLSLLTI